MPNRPQKLQPRAHCVFCGKPQVSHEHIWPQWIQKALPRGWDRGETVKGVVDQFGNRIPDKPRKIKQGAVHTKTARKVCIECNRGWMRLIGEAAQSTALQLIRGEAVHLDADKQTAVAAWISLSAMMADLVTKTQHKLPTSDLHFFYRNHQAPPHWHIFIGHYAGREIVAFDHSPFPLVARNNSRNVIGKFIFHSMTLIIGHLFVIVHCHNKTGTPIVHGTPPEIPWYLYAPRLLPIWPFAFNLIGFPSPQRMWITGTLDPNGGLAATLARQVQEGLITAFAAAGFEHR